MKNLLYKLLYRLCGNLPLRIISDDGKPYLERYYVGTFLRKRVYVHRFVGSDPMRGWHDHPWYPAVSLVLWGEYGEERFEPTPFTYSYRRGVKNITTKRIRWYNVLPAKVAHRVVIGDDWSPGVDGANCTSRSRECWTVFVHPENYTSPWGFWRDIKPTTIPNNSTVQNVNWHPFDGKIGVSTSGEWWNTSPVGKLNNDRLPSIL